MKPLTVKEFFKQFKNDDACLEHIMKIRHGLSGICPKCNEKTRFYRVASQRAYACKWCGWHTYPCVGTPFEDSRTPLQFWFYAIYLFTQTRSGVSAKELQRQLGVTYKTAWRMGHLIRLHMANVDGDDPLSGHIEADETYVGGKKKAVKGKRGRGTPGKTIVFGMLARGGRVITKVVPDTTMYTLHGLVEKYVEKGSTISTDEYVSYNLLDAKGYKHDRVNHSKKEYVRGDVHVNGLESYWARIKLSIRGTHIHVSSKYLSFYVKEFEFRHNARKRPGQMLPDLLSTFAPPLMKGLSQISPYPLLTGAQG